MIKNGSDELANTIKVCREKIIHVSNPPIEIDGADGDELNINKRKRAKSREILLKHLMENWREDYKPQKLQTLSAEITDYMEQKIESKKKLSEKEKKKIRRR